MKLNFSNVVILLFSSLVLADCLAGEYWDLKIVKYYKDKDINLVKSNGGHPFINDEEGLSILASVNGNGHRLNHILKGKYSALDITDIQFSKDGSLFWFFFSGAIKPELCIQRRYFRKCSGSEVFPTPWHEEKFKTLDSYENVRSRDSSGDLLAISQYKGGVVIFNDNYPNGKLIWEPEIDLNWSRDVAVRNNYVFFIHEGKNLIIYELSSDRLLKLASKNNNYINTLSASNNNLFLGGNGLYYMGISEIDEIFRGSKRATQVMN